MSFKTSSPEFTLQAGQGKLLARVHHARHNGLGFRIGDSIGCLRDLCFALIEIFGRKGNVPPPHIHHRGDETFYILEGEMTASVGLRSCRHAKFELVAEPNQAQSGFL